VDVPAVRGVRNEVDQIRPVLFGGDDDEFNLQGLCAACNLSKGER
jgi:5-methylcytosine-specific restriction endonuclease McrA